MAGRRQAKARMVARRRRANLVRKGAQGLIAVVVVGVAAVLLLQLRSDPAEEPGGLPGPIGGSSVAQDVGTLVGQPAPAFTLSDSEGTSYTVTPGQGWPIVLVSHMGIT